MQQVSIAVGTLANRFFFLIRCGVKWRRGKILNGEQQHHLFKKVEAENETKKDAALVLMSLVS